MNLKDAVDTLGKFEYKRPNRKIKWNIESDRDIRIELQMWVHDATVTPVQSQKIKLGFNKVFFIPYISDEKEFLHILDEFIIEAEMHEAREWIYFNDSHLKPQHK